MPHNPSHPWFQADLATYRELTLTNPQAGAAIASHIMERLPACSDPSAAAYLRGVVFAIRQALRSVYGWCSSADDRKGIL